MASWNRQAATTAVLAIVSAIALAGSGSPQTEFIRAQQANKAALREYTWKRRTELKLKGETRNVTLELVRYDIDGRLQKTPIGGSADDRDAKPSAPLGRGGLLQHRIVAKKKGQFEELMRDLAALAGSYAELTPSQLQAFGRGATISPGDAPLTGTVRLHGRNVVASPDDMSVWIDPKTFATRRVEIETTLESKPVDLTSDYRTLDNGLTYQARTVLRYLDKELELVVESFEYQHVGTSR
jgi:hypothetical protein